MSKFLRGIYLLHHASQYHLVEILISIISYPTELKREKKKISEQNPQKYAAEQLRWEITNQKSICWSSKVLNDGKRNTERDWGCEFGIPDEGARGGGVVWVRVWLFGIKSIIGCM